MTRGWCVCVCLSLFFGLGLGLENYRWHHRYTRTPPVFYPTIYVDQSGHGNFTTIQSAIDSIPPNNKNWICVYIKAGEYREQVNIRDNRPFIYLKGEGKRKTSVVWGASGSILTSPTFKCQADNIVVKSIGFRNSYNNPYTESKLIRVAVAAMITGDKSAFYRCGFYGFQDTLWDVQGRHYFHRCTIQGAVDFIFGSGQSIYESCVISVTAGALRGLAGFITAQGRKSPLERNGFVFKNCYVVGTGRTYLGRPWGQYARVVFFNSFLSDVVIPQGWDAWENIGHEYLLTFAESGCYGRGADPFGRVKWETKLSEEVLTWLTNIEYIDSEGWISRQPFHAL
ncbi:Pectinesterase [Bertholletia excelsa]